jgi:hypothetical protein
MESSQWEHCNHLFCRKVSFSRSFIFSFRYIYDVLLLINCSFGDFVDRIYPIELEIKDSTDTDMFPSYLDLHLEIDNEAKNETLRQKRWLQCSHCENFRSKDFNLTKRNPWFSSFLASSNPISRKSRYEPQAMDYRFNWEIYTPVAFMNGDAKFGHHCNWKFKRGMC